MTLPRCHTPTVARVPAPHEDMRLFDRVVSLLHRPFRSANRAGGRPSRHLLVCAPLLILGLGCATAQPSAVDLGALLRSRGLDPNRVIQPFAITPEMAAWARERVAGAPAGADELEVLLKAVLEERELSVQYEWGSTATAVEAFEQRRANCLGFANLLVGLGREIGVPARFLLVEEVDNVKREGDLVVLAEHATVGYGPPSQRKVLVFSLEAEEFYRDARTISDLTAIALFYSNRGAEAVRTGDLLRAVEHLETAVRIDPELAQAWVNLGVASRRSGDFERAEAAYLRALAIDPERTSAYQNFAALLRYNGAEQAADDLLEMVERLGTPDPYAYLNLAEIALERNRVAAAERFFRKALARGRHDAEVQAAVGLWKLDSGRITAARRRYRKALDLNPEGARVLMLGRRLAELQAGDR